MPARDETIVEDYRFRADDLHPQDRATGISLFMRIRNGAAFLETAIRSHIPYVDEIVAVYNQCTDETPAILARLADEYGRERLRVFHYLPAVFPPGSAGHASEPADSPRSLVNYYNFALSQTRYRHVAKLDDDHLAIQPGLAEVARRLRKGDFDGEMVCFSGPNLARSPDGRIGVLAAEPFSGNGDIGFFPVSLETYFTHDRRFERFHRGGLKRRFRGFLYWHLKYLKQDLGFGNYDLAANPGSRYAKRMRLLEGAQSVLDLTALRAQMPPRFRRRLGWLPLPEKQRLLRDRWLSFADQPPDASLATALHDLGLASAQPLDATVCVREAG